MDEETKKAVGTLARNIIETNSINGEATNISMCTNSVSKDKFIIKHNEQAVKRSIDKIKDKIHKINEYVEEIENHVYNPGNDIDLKE